MSPQNLIDELMCPICLNMLNKTMTSTECLHRFCSDCIITALQFGNKECPMCRKQLVSLLPDPIFDLLISNIYPSRYEYNVHKSRVFEELNKNHSQAKLVQSINDGIDIQAQNHLQRYVVKKQQDKENKSSCLSTTPNIGFGKDHVLRNVVQAGVGHPKTITVSKRDSVSTPVDKSDVSEQDGSPRGVASDEMIELVLRPHPIEMDSNNQLIRQSNVNTVRYIKTTANATVNHISKYMSMRFAFNGTEVLTFLIYIVSATTDQTVLLNGNQTLRQVHNKYWNMNKPLEMYFLFN